MSSVSELNSPLRFSLKFPSVGPFFCPFDTSDIVLISPTGVRNLLEEDFSPRTFSMLTEG